MLNPDQRRAGGQAASITDNGSISKFDGTVHQTCSDGHRSGNFLRNNGPVVTGNTTRAVPFDRLKSPPSPG